MVFAVESMFSCGCAVLCFPAANLTSNLDIALGDLTDLYYFAGLEGREGRQNRRNERH